MDPRFDSGLNSDSPCRYPSTRVRPWVAVEKSSIRNGRHHSSGRKEREREGKKDKKKRKKKSWEEATPLHLVCVCFSTCWLAANSSRAFFPPFTVVETISHRGPRIGLVVCKEKEEEENPQFFSRRPPPVSPIMPVRD